MSATAKAAEPAVGADAPNKAEQTMAREDDEGTIQLGSIPQAARIANLICFPFDLLCGWQTVNQREVVAAEYCGVVTNVLDEPGFYRQPFCGMTARRVTTAEQTMDLPNTKIVDASGSPLIVSAIVNYRVSEPLKAIYDVNEYVKYVSVNSQAVVKHVVAEHTYENLKSNTDTVNAQLQKEMQIATAVAGVQIRSVAINELNYAPEIAASMLKKQAATAMLEARQVIVQGAVEIAQDAVTALEKDSSIKLSNEDKVKIVTNLLIVTCGDSDAQPTISVG